MLAKNEAFRNYHRPNACRVKLSQFLQFADVAIGGDRSWDIQVHDDRFY